MNRIFNIDCMEGMANTPDKYYELAIVDPPYGIGMDGRKGSVAKLAAHSWRSHEFRGWDSAVPPSGYFTELFRISENQIICGGNYFTLPISKGWVFWDKGQDLTMPDGELIWTSFAKPLRRIVINRCAAREDGIIHPTQKPVALYRWLLKNYAKAGDKILDTHGGSMSSVIACLEAGHEITCYEKDPDYFEAAKQRIETWLSQCNMFSERPGVEFNTLVSA